MADGEDRPVPLDGPITLIDDAAYISAWHDTLTGPRCTLVEVDLAGARGRDDMFRAVSDALHLPADGGISKWSGLQDRLWEAVAGPGAAAGVIAIRRIDSLLDGALDVLLELVSILAELARLSDARAPGAVGTHLDLYAVLTGTSSNFPEITPA